VDTTTPEALTTTPGGAGELTIASKIGRYQIEHIVGTGGMGVVFAAHDPELGRQVAIKVLSTEREVAHTRLLREAQAMARLSHSNVVTVHEVLKIGDRAAIVMELVDGRDLADWLAKAQRGWREILDAFVQAARGLAAAHKAGMVHRDFKPANALIDRDGVVRVTDFGLVRAVPDAEPVAAGDQHDVTLTQTGARIGTPAFMAPEQHEGGQVDARTDQWAFACALYGALYRQPPFAGETYAELANAVKLEKLRPEPATTKVPRAIRASIRRALSRDPADRFASMEDLIRALTPPRRAWIGVGVVGGLAAVAAIGAVVLTGDDNTNTVSCDGLDAPFTATWNADRARVVSKQFASTGLGNAASAADAFNTALDRYRGSWTTMRTRACTEARGGAISPDLLDRRMQCLDVRLAEIGVVVDAATVVDASTLNSVGGALGRVPDVTTCDEPIDTMPRPTDTAARAAIARAETDLARASALSNLGRFDQARALAESATKVADQTGWAPLTGQALYEIAQAQGRVGNFDAALTSFERVAEAAARAGDDLMFARALIHRFNILAYDSKRVDEAFAGRHYIELAVLRAHAPVARAMWLAMLASALQAQGKSQEALDTQIEATAMWRQIAAPDSIALSDCLNNEATYRIELGQLDEAQAILEKLLVTDAFKLGPGNPELARRHYNLAFIAQKRNDDDTALTRFEQAYAIRKAAGALNFMTPYALAEQLEKVGRPGAAAPLFTEALDILDRTQKSSGDRVAIRYELGTVMTELGQLAEARTWLEQTVTIARATNSTYTAEVLASFAFLEVAAGDVPTARRYIAESRADSKARKAEESETIGLAEAAIAMRAHDCARAEQVFARLTKHRGAANLNTILTEALVGRAECALQNGTAAARADAREAIEKRLAYLEVRKPEPGALAPLRFMLARMQVATGGENKLARTLAETARDGFATLGDPGNKRAAEVTRWLAALE
jgi:eukaryotic-like serine/threonine-protein kinase